MGAESKISFKQSSTVEASYQPNLGTTHWIQTNHFRISELDIPILIIQKPKALEILVTRIIQISGGGEAKLELYKSPNYWKIFDQIHCNEHSFLDTPFRHLNPNHPKIRVLRSIKNLEDFLSDPVHTVHPRNLHLKFFSKHILDTL